MIITLPLVLFIVMCELAIGAFTVMFVLDWRNLVKRNFLVLYGIIYIGLAALTYVVQQNFSTPSLLNTFPQLDKAWTGYETLPMLLFVLLMLPYNLFLWLDKNAGVDGKEKAAAIARTAAEGDGDGKNTTSSTGSGHISASPARILRLVSGSLVVLAGLITLFVMAMIYRPLAEANLGGTFTVISFFAAAMTLGGVMTAMWLGHWYLVTPALSEKPLQFATTLVLIGVVIQIVAALAMGPATISSSKTSTATAPVVKPAATATPAPHGTAVVKPANVPVIAPVSTTVIVWLRILVSFVLPLVLGSLAWILIRGRSFQSATGMLYLIVVCTLAGEGLARGLLLMGLT